MRIVSQGKIMTTLAAVACAGLLASCMPAPDVLAQEEQPSVGRGWPVPVALEDYDGYPEEQFVGSVTPWYYQVSATATGGNVPDGVTALEPDLFT